MYISFFNTLINISGFIAPLIGVWIYSYISIYSSMLLIGLLRVAAASTFIIRWLMWRRKMPAENAASM